MGRFHPRQNAGVNFIVGEAASPTNPDKGCAGKLKTNYSDRPRDVSTGDYKCMSAWPRMNLR